MCSEHQRCSVSFVVMPVACYPRFWKIPLFKSRRRACFVKASAMLLRLLEGGCQHATAAEVVRNNGFDPDVVSVACKPFSKRKPLPQASCSRGQPPGQPANLQPSPNFIQTKQSKSPCPLPTSQRVWKFWALRNWEVAREVFVLVPLGWRSETLSAKTVLSILDPHGVAKINT